MKDIPAKQSSAIEQIRPLEGNERSLTRQFFWASYGSILRQFGWPDQILFGGAAVTFSYSYAGGGRRLKFSFVDGRMMRATN